MIRPIRGLDAVGLAPTMVVAGAGA